MEVETIELGLSKRLIDEMVVRVRQLSENVNSNPFDGEADDANAERRRLWKVLEFAKDELRESYGIEYVPSAFEGKSFFFHKDTYKRFLI